VGGIAAPEIVAWRGVAWYLVGGLVCSLFHCGFGFFNRLLADAPLCESAECEVDGVDFAFLKPVNSLCNDGANVCTTLGCTGLSHARRGRWLA
jgi:uncharacterized membrane protein